ncbi:MAG: hypothetical protein LBB50_00615, partial [Oscillospiraceae bacterium]|nr:hypothetical protein [Oscillospiraceae bacterium]
MKNCEEFRASVYARAQVRKNETAARKIKIRNTVLSVMVVAVAAAATVPIARRGRLFPPATEPPPNKAQQVVVGRLQLENVRDKQLVAVVEKENNTPGFAVLNSSAKQKAFVRQYKTVNHLNETQDIAMSPVYGEAKTVHSAEELNEYLDALPQSTALLRQIASFYGDAFFSANDLCV